MAVYFGKRGVILAKKKLNKAQRREQRLRKAGQWIVTYRGTPKKIVKHYKERFHVDTVCALKDLQEIGVEFTQEYLDAVKRSEEERLKQKRMQRLQKEQEKLALMYDDCDDTFAFIAGYTDGGAPYGTTWWEAGIDPDLPFDEKVRQYMEMICG